MPPREAPQPLSGIEEVIQGRRSSWPKFVAWSRLTQLREVVSLDGILCPNVFHELTAEDWKHNVHANCKTHLFYDPDHVAARTAGQAVNVLALIEEPGPAAVASFQDPRFGFCGFDLIEEQSGISALVNCGGFDKAFQPADLCECGLLVDYAKAVNSSTVPLSSSSGIRPRVCSRTQALISTLAASFARMKSSCPSGALYCS